MIKRKAWIIIGVIIITLSYLKIKEEEGFREVVIEKTDKKQLKEDLKSFNEMELELIKQDVCGGIKFNYASKYVASVLEGYKKDYEHFEESEKIMKHGFDLFFAVDLAARETNCDMIGR